MTIPSLRCLLALLLLAASAALAQTAPEQRLNTVDRWVSAPHTGGPPERFTLSVVSLDPAKTPAGGATMLADVKAASLEKAGDAGGRPFG